MKVVHQFFVAVRCPVDDAVDIYEVVVETDRVVKVEEILKASEKQASSPAFQEEYTQRLANDLGTKVVTTGRHSGVDTTCEAAPL